MKEKLPEKIWVIDDDCGLEIGTVCYVTGFDIDTQKYFVEVPEMCGTWSYDIHVSYVTTEEPEDPLKDVIHDHIKKKYGKTKYSRKLENIGRHYYRLKVPNGWIVSFEPGDVTNSLVFVPDPKHEWVLEDK